MQIRRRLLGEVLPKLRYLVGEALDEISFRNTLLPSFFQAAKLSLTMAHSPRREE